MVDNTVYDAATFCPVFYGYGYEKKITRPRQATGLNLEVSSPKVKAKLSTVNESEIKISVRKEETVLDPRVSHPACSGYLLEKKVDLSVKEEEQQSTGLIGLAVQDKSQPTRQMPARTYLEQEIFPVLLPALEAMLASAKENNVLRWKRTKFNACDFLTEYLYNNNTKHSNNREQTDLWEIPFVDRINKENPRPPLALSLLWTDDEAAIVLQSCWRGRKVRMNSEVQELRKYQEEMREQEYDIVNRVEDFWKKHPVEEVTPSVAC